MSVDSALAPSSSTGPSPTTVPPFDQVSVAIAPGDDLVVRMPGILLVVGVEATPAPPPAAAPKLGGWGAAPVKAPVAAPIGDTKVGELVALCRRVSAAGSRAPGRRLHEELRRWLPTVSDLPSFALAAATEEGLAVALVGDGVAEVPDLGLRLTPADGERLQDGTRILDRLVDWPPAPLRLSAGGAVDMAPHPLADLEAGVVPGAAAVLSPAVAPAPTPMPDAPSPTTLVRLPSPNSLLPPPGVPAPPVPAAPAPVAPPVAHDHEHDHPHEHPHPPVQDGAVPSPAPSPEASPQAEAPAPPAPPPMELPPPAFASSLLAPPEEEAPRVPLPVLDTEQPPAALIEQEPEDTRPKVKGFLCSRGHLNDPRVLFCNLCGIRMAERTGVFIEGVRPPLGLLVFDNGATVSLDMDYLLGREPETDDRVVSAELRPLLVVDQTGGVSRHHAEIRLEGWDVVLVDIGSANGTLVAPPGAPAWQSLVPNQPVRLVPGMAVRMGSRQFAFESPHGAT